MHARQVAGWDNEGVARRDDLAAHADGDAAR